MTEQEYDEQIAPALMEIARKVEGLGGSIVARVEWENGGAGHTLFVPEGAGIGQHLARFAVLSHGNLDNLVLTALKHFDSSQTIVGRIMGGAGFEVLNNQPDPTR